MKFLKLVTLLLTVVGCPAWAQSNNVQIENCDPSFAEKILAAHFIARERTNYAFDVLNLHYLSSHELQGSYKKWFGSAPDKNRPAYVADTYRSIYANLQAGTTKHACVAGSNEPCQKKDANAYAYPQGDGYVSHYCPRVFNWDVEALWPLIIHELSHVNKVRGTDDYCYGEFKCKKLAIDDPSKAIRSADSYANFAEFELDNFLGKPLPSGPKLFP